MTDVRKVVARYILAAKVKDYVQLFRKMAPQIERKLREDPEGAVELFRKMGEQLSPLATMLDGVRFERKDEQRKMKSVLQWLHRLKYPFAEKNLSGPTQDAVSWISIQLESIEDSLKSLVRVQDRLDSYRTVEKDFQHGPFKIINKFGYRPEEYAEAMKLLDDASSKIQSKGFGSILYGDVYLVGGSEDKGRKSWAGMYKESPDIVLLNAEARFRFSDVHTFVHELGHRYWHKKLSGPQRDAYEDNYSKGEGITLEARQDMWQALVRGDFSPAKAVGFLKDPNVPLIEYFKDTFSGSGMSQKDATAAYKRGEMWLERNFVRPGRKYVFIGDNNTVTVSQYAKTGVGEDFAETFAHYVLGMPIPPEVMVRFEPTV